MSKGLRSGPKPRYSAIGWSLDDRDHVDLDQRSGLCQRHDLHQRAGRRVGRPELLAHLIVGLAVSHVGDVDRRLAHVLHAGARRLQDRANALHGGAGLDTGVAGPRDAHVQTRTAMERIRTILEAAGASMKDVGKTTVYVTDMRYREAYNEVRQEFWATDPPASTLVQVVALAEPAALIEIDVIAVIE